MRRLVIDTATEACSVALLQDDEVIAHVHDLLGCGHAERLIPIIAELPEGGRADEVFVDCGPGSFTGIRIGLAAAKGLGLAWSVAVRGFSVMSLIDTGAYLNNPAWRELDRAIVMEGGHGEWFVQLRGLTANSEIKSLKPDGALEWIGARPVAGTRAELVDEMRGTGEAIHLFPDARWVGNLLPEEFLSQASPIYSRGADAKKMVV